MEQKYIEVDSVTLSYLEQNGHRRKTLFFLHGNSGSSLLWERQYRDRIFDSYSIVAFDLPGHGQSSGIPSKDYSVSNLARIMSNAVKLLANGRDYALTGLSLGGNIVAEMLVHGVAPKGLVFLSAGLVGKEVPLSDVIQNDLVVDVLFKDNCPRDRVEEYFNGLPYKHDSELVTSLVRDYDRTNKEFRLIFPQTVGQGMYSDELALIRSWKGSPLAIYGNQDNIVKPDLLDHVSIGWWKESIFKIDKAAHLVNIDNPSVINQLMLDYLIECF